MSYWHKNPHPKMWVIVSSKSAYIPAADACNKEEVNVFMSDCESSEDGEIFVIRFFPGGVTERYCIVSEEEKLAAQKENQKAFNQIKQSLLSFCEELGMTPELLENENSIICESK